MDLIWQSVDAVVQAGGWDETVFMLTWDDWGGYDDHVKTPVLEYTPDNVQSHSDFAARVFSLVGRRRPVLGLSWRVTEVGDTGVVSTRRR
jgi:phospholipase C